MGLEMKYFILKPKSKFKGDPWAKASRQAMLMFADFIEVEDLSLARSLEEWVKDENEKDELMD